MIYNQLVTWTAFAILAMFYYIKHFAQKGVTHAFLVLPYPSVARIICNNIALKRFFMILILTMMIRKMILMMTVMILMTVSDTNLKPPERKRWVGAKTCKMMTGRPLCVGRTHRSLFSLILMIVTTYHHKSLHNLCI